LIECPPEPALGKTLFTDFTKGASPDWEVLPGTTLTYDPTNGAAFTISRAGNAPTIAMHKYIMFGRMEVVMKASPGKGTVSSLVLQSADLDEIDWEWLGADTSHVQSNFFGKGDTSTYDRGGVHEMADPTAGFHTYTIDWTKERMQWLIDGNVVRETVYADPKAKFGERYPQTPMEVKMGSWIGCASKEAETDPKTKGTCEWAGGAIDFAGGPYVMYVKSVKVTDYGCADTYVYSDRSGSYQSIKSVGGCEGGKGDNNDEDTPVKPSSTTTKTQPSSTSAQSSTTKAPMTPSSTTSAVTRPSTTSPAVLIETSASFATISTKTSEITATRQAANITQSGTPTATTTPAQVTGGASMTGASTIVLALGLAVSYLLM
jgi:beta-glucanase (GH16 family)